MYHVCLDYVSIVGKATQRGHNKNFVFYDVNYFLCHTTLDLPDP